MSDPAESLGRITWVTLVKKPKNEATFTKSVSSWFLKKCGQMRCANTSLGSGEWKRYSVLGMSVSDTPSAQRLELVSGVWRQLTWSL